MVFKSTFDAEAEENYDKLGGKASSKSGSKGQKGNLSTTATDTEAESILEVDNFESLMLNIDKSELEGFKSGRSSGATTTDFDSELERSARAFREEDLFDTKRKSKLQAETKEIDPTQL